MNEPIQQSRTVSVSVRVRVRVRISASQNGSGSKWLRSSDLGGCWRISQQERRFLARDAILFFLYLWSRLRAGQGRAGQGRTGQGVVREIEGRADQGRTGRC